MRKAHPAQTAQRIRFLDGVLAALDQARREGVPLLGYIHWSLPDNFEWLAGLTRFGLVAVDRATFARSPKPSARHYAALVRGFMRMAMHARIIAAPARFLSGVLEGGKMMRKPIAVALAALLAAAPAAAQDQAGTVQVAPFALPPSNQLSAEARRILVRQLAERSPDFGADIAAARAYYGKFNDDRLAEMHRLFATREERTTIGGVAVDVVTPAGGVPARHARRVLINIHGGAFMWGSGSGALVEAIPVAATAGMKVVTIDYRLAPEHRYPAASEDVAAVYAELLRTYRAEDIGIYGCSAGGIITAQAVSWFQTHRLPSPGAIGTFCGTGAPYGGDSVFLSGPTMAARPMIPGTVLPDTLPTAYLAGVPASDTGAYPVMNDAVLARFPPTLLLAGSRDFAASVMTTTHRRLTRLGVPSELYIFDGLPHAFFMWPGMPESREAYGLIARFFDARLGRRQVR